MVLKRFRKPFSPDSGFDVRSEFYISVCHAVVPVARYCCVIPEASLNVFTEVADTFNGAMMKVAINTNTNKKHEILFFFSFFIFYLAV